MTVLSFRKKHILYLHDGPGLNSNAIEGIIDQFSSKHEVHYWNEPSSLRRFDGTPSYQDCLESLKEFCIRFNPSVDRLIIIAHGFGAYYAHYLGHELTEMVDSIILLNPILNIESWDKRMGTIANQLIMAKR